MSGDKKDGVLTGVAKENKASFVNTSKEYQQAFNLMKDQLKLSSDVIDQYTDTLFNDYSASVSFNDVLPGKYNLDVRACIFGAGVADYYDWASLQITVTVGTTTKGPVYFNATINPKADPNKSEPYLVSLGFFDNIEVTTTSKVQANFKILDESFKSAKVMDIDSKHTSFGVTLLYVE
jgi:hypothetical protein